ncbi:tRNA pseudouridine synthase Pus10-like [Apostichopus japonicus]|uniref:tRNA pseudouridine synthase Pus10-like n=1 Tax=Stichopus japonicus TaxID=307972 RepID=UPI003AB2D8DF
MELEAMKSSIWQGRLFLLYLRENKRLKLEKFDVVDVKDIFKWVCGPMMSSELKVPFRLKSPFELHMTFHNAGTESEVFDLLSGTSPRKKKRRFFKPKPTKAAPPTKQQVIGQLKEKSSEELKALFNFPPSSPASYSICKMEGLHEPIFIAGRYNKYSRSLSQTPWILEGTRMTTSSVQELICEPMKDFIRATGYNFVASGREDVDVKTLGKGRPFAAEMSCPHKTTVTTEDMRILQNTINNQTTNIAVRDLQIVTREETSKLKEGEQEKTKDYTALVWVAKEVTPEMLETFDKIENLTLQQKTPIRVLHRRPLATREKIVHSLSTTPVDDHHFKLHLCTQAGTYIKEFVHGDFGRTEPNVSTILGTEADILVLDVEAVNLDWPKPIDGEEIKDLPDDGADP